MALDGILFDVDGTLVDSNPAHVEAWVAAFAANGYRVAADRIAVEVGKGGDKLIPSILGQDVERHDGKKLREAHSVEFTRIAHSKTLPLTAGAEELLAELRRRGLKTALATSSSREGLQTTEKSVGVQLRKWVDVVITSDDVSESKPSPDLLIETARKLKLSPAQCAMVGDTPFDIEASRDGGLICVGLTCGRYNEAETLRSAGARIVYRDPADLLTHLDDALKMTSPGSAHLDQKLIESLMREALAVARDGMDHGEAPIGALLARGDGTIIARGYNELLKSSNPTSHAEIVTFKRAAGLCDPAARDLILVCTLEPCVMCLGAAMEAAIDTILYALPAPADGGTHRVKPPQSPESQMPRILGQLLADESRRLFKEFLRRGSGNPQQMRFVRQLLELT